MVINEFRGPHAFLSNFFPAVVTFAGRDYPTVEHALAAAQTKKKTEREKLCTVHAPADARLIARTRAHQGQTREDWEQIKERVMLMLLRQKFDQQPFKKWLLETGDTELIESQYGGDPYSDKFWGVRSGEGQNRLGMLLMQVRDELQDA